MDTIEVSGLTVSRGEKKVLHNLSFTVRRGMITALLGSNGAGKSSTVMTMAGVLAPDRGSIRFGRHDLTGQPPDRVRRLGIALVPEGHRVLRTLTVEENLCVASPARDGAGRAAALKRVYTIFPELAERCAQRAGDLSGGQKQMVAMAQAFIAKPAFMIVDELSLGLAPAIVRRLATTLRSAADEGVGVLLIEQFATLALEISEHALVLERGHKVFDASPALLKDRPEILHAAYL